MTLESLGHLESVADDLDASLRKGGHHDGLPGLDVASLRADLLRSKTDIISLRTDAERLLSMVERYVAERRKRSEEISRQRTTTLREIELWLNRAREKTGREIKMYSPDDVANNIKINEVRRTSTRDNTYILCISKSISGAERRHRSPRGHPRGPPAKMQVRLRDIPRLEGSRERPPVAPSGPADLPRRRQAHRQPEEEQVEGRKGKPNSLTMYCTRAGQLLIFGGCVHTQWDSLALYAIPLWGDGGFRIIRGSVK